MIVVLQVWAQGRPLQVSSVFYVLALLNLPQLVSQSTQPNALSAWDFVFLILTADQLLAAASVHGHLLHTRCRVHQ